MDDFSGFKRVDGVVRIIASSALLLLLAVLGVAILLFQRETLSREADSSGHYVVETSAHKIDLMWTRMPGDGGGYPAFVEIFDKVGESMGRMPVPMRDMAGVSFSESGASIDGVGRWNFKNNTCWYSDGSFFYGCD